MADRFDIRPDAEAWEVCDRRGVFSIRDARRVRGNLRIEAADELAYEMSRDPEMAAAILASRD